MAPAMMGNQRTTLRTSTARIPVHLSWQGATTGPPHAYTDQVILPLKDKDEYLRTRLVSVTDMQYFLAVQ